MGPMGLDLMGRSKIMQSFVARIWLERAADEDPKWRGHIQHIQGQEETYFQDLTEMSTFMEQVSGIRSSEFDPDQQNVVAMSKHSALVKLMNKRARWFRYGFANARGTR